MTYTTLATWSNVFGETFDDGYNADPFDDLNLTTDERDVFLSDCRDHLISEVDAIIAPYGATILGNGDIIGPVDGDFPERETPEWDDLKESIGMIDFDAVIEPLTSPFKCTPYATDRDLPRRAVGIRMIAYTDAGEMVLITARQSRSWQTELYMSLGDLSAQVAISEMIPAYVFDEMIAELGGYYTPGLAHELMAELNFELREARYLEELKAGRLATN